MIRNWWISAIAGLLLVSPFSAASATSIAASNAALPPGVQAIMHGYADQCTALGGTLSGEQTPALMSADLDGDEKPDFVINAQRLQCSTSATAFCGNGGCQIAVALSGDGYGQPLSALGGQPTMVQTPDGTRVEIWVSRQNCTDMRRSSACWASYSWPGGKPLLTYASRPVVR